MGFKNIESKIGFAELALSSSMAKNRSLKTLEQMNKVIDWSRIENLLMKYYKVGTSDEGADAYPPLMLFKCLLHIPAEIAGGIMSEQNHQDWMQHKMLVLNNMERLE